MKKLNLYLLTMMMVVIPFLQSCDDDGYSLGDFIFRMATVHVISGNTYYLETDNGDKLWPAATQIPWYKPIDGQRVWADYTPLSDQIPETDYKHAIRVNYLFNVLTKTVDELTAENEEAIGNDPAYITDMWVSSNYLNMELVLNIPYDKPHRVSLVENMLDDDPVIDEEGYVCLEYRFKREKDFSNSGRINYVSFNLGEYGPLRLTDDAIKGLKVKINSIENGERVIAFEYKKNDNEEKKVRITNEVVNEGVE